MKNNFTILKRSVIALLLIISFQQGVFSQTAPYSVMTTSCATIDSIYHTGKTCMALGGSFNFFQAMKNWWPDRDSSYCQFKIIPKAYIYVSDAYYPVCTGDTISIDSINLSTKGKNIVVTIPLIHAYNSKQAQYSVELGFMIVSTRCRIPPFYAMYSIVKTFKTPLNSISPISNNFITSYDQSLIPAGNPSTYDPKQLLATMPGGASGNYSYIWQRKNDNGVWRNCTATRNGSQNYLPEKFTQPGTIVTETFYRRIVTSDCYRDTSNVVSIGYIPSKTPPGYGTCVYDPLGGINRIYAVSNLQFLNVTDTSATLSANFISDPNGAVNAYEGYTHYVKFGFLYDTLCNNVSNWQQDGANRINGPAFPPAGVNRVDNNIVVNQGPAFSTNAGTNYLFQLHGLKPNRIYYVHWFVRDSIDQPLINGPSPSVRMPNRVLTGATTDSLITDPCYSFKSSFIVQTIADTIGANSAGFTCKFKGINPSVAGGALYYMALCYSTDSLFDPIKCLQSNHAIIQLGANRPGGLFDNSFPVTISNLIPKQKYYARAVYYKVLGAPYKGTIPADSVSACYGNLISFSTGITNNRITSANQTICLTNGNSVAFAKPIKASFPEYSIGKCHSYWQKKSSLNNTWENCLHSADSIARYTPSGFEPNTGKGLVTVKYRRIVSSGMFRDTSNEVSLYYLPSNYKPSINIEQMQTSDNSMRLVGNAPPELTNFTAAWKSSALNGGQTTLINNTNIHTITQDAKKKYLSQIFWVEMNAGKGCPVFSSAKIQVTPPDGDENIYPAINIGSQLWMINNLKTTKFSDGTPIRSVKDSVLTVSADYSWYNNDPIASASYGALYNCVVIQNDAGKNVCPEGWRPAAYSDWANLVNAGGGEAVAGNQLKTSYGWYYNNNASNSLNFNAKPGGQFNPQYHGESMSASWWGLNANATDPKSLPQPCYFEITAIDGRVYSAIFSSFNEILKTQHSIRCVKKTTP